MFRIGEFARICQITTQTLRYYDQIGLLEPNRIDAFTGYRFYSISQLPRLNRILALKDLGLALDEITLVLNNDLSPDELRGMLRLKAAELEAQVAEGQTRLDRVRARLHMIEKEHQMPQQEVVFKSVPAQRYLSFREVTPNPTQQFKRMTAALEKQAFDWASNDRIVALYYGPGDESGIDMATGILAPDGFEQTVPLDGDGALTVTELPAVERMACLLHKGSYGALCDSYQAFWRWIEANGYRIVDPCREVYLNDCDAVPEEELLVEIQYQLEKA